MAEFTSFHNYNLDYTLSLLGWISKDVVDCDGSKVMMENVILVYAGDYRLEYQIRFNKRTYHDK